MDVLSDSFQNYEKEPSFIKSKEYELFLMWAEFEYFKQEEQLYSCNDHPTF
jgi:hypothetical protein